MLGSIRPDLRVARVTDISAQDLHDRGFIGVLLDLDNTLLPWKDSSIPDSSRLWIESAKQTGLKLCIVSNTHYPKRLNNIAAELGIECVARALKPRAHGFRKAAGMLGCDLASCAVVGDQLFTDILGGNLAGAFTILVNPMHHREFIGTKVSRCLEWIAFRLMRMEAPQGTKSDSSKSKEEDTK